MKSFGWTDDEKYNGRDICEFIQILWHAIEKPLSNTQCHAFMLVAYQDYVQCIDVNYEQSREEKQILTEFTTNDNEKTLDECIDSYHKRDLLSGDNMFCTPNGEKQSAWVGRKLTNCPDVMLFAVKRYQFNFETFCVTKSQNPISYPTCLDLSTRSKETKDQYTLVGVAVQRGSHNASHYFVYIRPYYNSEQWVLFNDTQVTEVTEAQALSEINDSVLFMYVRTCMLDCYMAGFSIIKHFGDMREKKFKNMSFAFA